jgi:Methionine gamma-lyase
VPARTCSQKCRFFNPMLQNACTPSLNAPVPPQLAAACMRRVPVTERRSLTPTIGSRMINEVPSRACWSCVGPASLRCRRKAQPVGVAASAPATSVDLVDACTDNLQTEFAYVDQLVCENMSRVQRAFSTANISRSTLHGSSGATMWQALDKATAQIMGTEAAIMRLSILSGAPATAVS